MLEDRKPVSARADLRVDDPEAGRNHVEKPPPVTPNATDDSIPPKPLPTPFYRTRRGIIIIAVVVAVALAAIIGGAVGGSLKSKSSTAQSQTPDSGQGGGVAPTDSTTVQHDPVSSVGSTPGPPTQPTTLGNGVTTVGSGGGQSRALVQATPVPGPQEFGLTT